jgi:hypothetical protein
MIKFRGCLIGRTMHRVIWNFIKKSFRNSLYIICPENREDIRGRKIVLIEGVKE